MSRIFNLLIINGHPITAEAYNNTLLEKNLVEDNIVLKISTVCNINDAINKINLINFDLILLDTNLSKSPLSKIASVESLYKYAKKKFPLTKIVIITSYEDNLRLLNILSKINPDSLLLKPDITKYDLKLAIKKVLEGNPYYSNSINKLLRKKISQNIILDPIDTNILKELSNGSKMMELLKLIPLTKSGIEKRKRRLKNVFQTNSNSDRELVLAARERGFI